MKSQLKFGATAIALLLFAVLTESPSGLNAQESSPETAAKKDTALKYNRYPSRFRGSQPFRLDQPFLIRFNAPVDIEKVSRYFSFYEEENDVLIAVAAKRPGIEEARSLGMSVPKGTTAEKWDLLDQLAVITPVKKLIVGKTWYLKTDPGLTSQKGDRLFLHNGLELLGKLDHFRISQASPVNRYDSERFISLTHNKFSLPGKSGFDKWVSIEPEPENFRIENEHGALHLRGDFNFGEEYEVTVEPGLVGRDGIELTKKFSDTIEFRPNRGFIKLPMFSGSQNASGHRKFHIETANLEEVRTRVKRLENDNLIFALKGYEDGYEGHGGDPTIPFSMVPGKTIYDQARQPTAELDVTESFSLGWDELDPSSEFGAYYLCSDGVSRSGFSDDQMGAHAIVQVTDIGLAWKQNREETLIYAFSVANGTPKPGATVRLLNDEGDEISSTITTGKGLALIPASAYAGKQLWLDVSLGGDRLVSEFSEDLDTISLWHFDIPYRYHGVEEGERRTLIFTDRDIYKPGETVHLKCISRAVDSDSLLDPTSGKAQLTVKDNRGREVVDKTVSLNANGTFDETFSLPPLGLGYHSVKVDFNDPDNPDDQDWNLISYHSFNVAEYRVNTFEVDLKGEDRIGDGAVTVPLSARYYMGKPLSKAKVTWNAYAYGETPIAKGLDGFEFGDPSQDTGGFGEEGELRLNTDGSSQIDFEFASNPENPFPQRVWVHAEVTDVNQQTISAHSSFVVHSSDYYIGIRKPEGIHRAGDSVSFAIAAVDTTGGVHEEPVKVSLTVEKEVWMTVKVKGSNGQIVARNEKHHELVHHDNIEVVTETNEATGLPQVYPEVIQFAEAGEYVITLESQDESGRPVLTRAKFHVIGVDEPAWSWTDVVSIDVIPDKSSYRVGDTAKLLVRSPVFGKALVTTERGGVLWEKNVTIDQHETVIEVPIEPGAAPNLFASVLIIRGSTDSPHKYREANYRIGYCQLDVEDPASGLEVTLDSGDQRYFVPGERVTVSAKITNHEGAGVPGAEVTLFAVDEGILSLSGYKTPEPSEVFNKAFPLSVMVGQSLSDLQPENPRESDFGNKGYVIGGGGYDESSRADLSRLHKDFKAVAFWEPGLVTNREGMVTHTFDAPDNLTSFRLMAVVVKGNQFGSADHPVVINKPLIIEPALPAVTNLSDQIDLTAVLHNNTLKAQRLEVEVTLDEHAQFVERLGEVIPTSVEFSPVERRTRLTQLTISPGQTEVLHFPTAMVREGEATWTWKVRSLSEDGLVDSTESKLDIGYPLPLLRSSRSVTLGGAQRSNDNLLAGIDTNLLRGRGEITVTMSNSRLIEGTDALEYLLRYPYGCIEQTTSSTLPWLSTEAMRKVLPDLNVSEAEIDQAIAKGLNRLLSMQTRSGGLSYWPGENEPVLWGSAYGGMALAIAQRSGVELPGERLDQLWEYLSKNLRNSAKLTSPYDLSQRCLSLYTLALAGRAEPAYHDTLFNRRDKLPPEARALLALAIMETGHDAEVPDHRLEPLLVEKPGNVRSDVTWYRQAYLKATSLMAWNRWKGEGDEVEVKLDELLTLKKPKNGWGSTYSNAWPLLALSQYGNSHSVSLDRDGISLDYDQETKVLAFDESRQSATFRFSFRGDRREVPMLVAKEDSKPLYAKVEISTQPDSLSLDPVNRGFAIEKTYHRVDLEGRLQPVDNLRIGDLVMVRLDLKTESNAERYLAIDDPLPAILEAINPTFQTQKTRGVKADKDSVKKGPVRLPTHHRELRKDRTVFFSNYVSREGAYRIEYLTRVVAAGDCIAPPVKIEAMYEPERYGLSGTTQLSARPIDFKSPEVALR